MELEESTFLTSDYTTKLQSTREYGTGVKTHIYIYIYRPMEKAGEPRDKPTPLWVPYFWQMKQEYTMGQRQPLQ